MGCQQRRRITAFPAVLDGPEAAQLDEVMFEFSNCTLVRSPSADCYMPKAPISRTDCQGFIQESSLEAHDKFSTNESYGTVDEKALGMPFSQCI
jgi:hypothetical protein